MDSVASELALRLGRPTNEVVEHSERRYQLRTKDNDPDSAAQCCNTLRYILYLLDREGDGRVFYRRLIDLGKQLQAAGAIRDGFQGLADAARREGKAADLAALGAQLEAALKGIAIPTDDTASLTELRAVLSAPASPLPSHRAELDAVRAGRR